MLLEVSFKRSHSREISQFKNVGSNAFLWFREWKLVQSLWETVCREGLVLKKLKIEQPYNPALTRSALLKQYRSLDSTFGDIAKGKEITVLCSMVTTVNNTAYLKAAKTVVFKSCYHNEKCNYMWGDGCWLNLLWKSFHNIQIYQIVTWYALR